LPWPAEPATAPDLEVSWLRDEFVGYISSWSATNRHAKAHGYSAFETFARDLAAAWPDGERRRVAWPLIIKLARKLDASS
jgi:hypothetical protein